MTDNDAPAAPGSTAAKAAGCTCDSRANRNGDGAGTNGKGETLFVIRPSCKLHGKRAA